jgi:hypothetical protein
LVIIDPTHALLPSLQPVLKHPNVLLLVHSRVTACTFTDAPAGTDINPEENPEASAGWRKSIFTDRASPERALIVTLWVTAPTPGYGVAPDGARLITSPLAVQASAA